MEPTWNRRETGRPTLQDTLLCVPQVAYQPSEFCNHEYYTRYISINCFSTTTVRTTSTALKTRASTRTGKKEPLVFVMDAMPVYSSISIFGWADNRMVSARPRDTSKRLANAFRTAAADVFLAYASRPIFPELNADQRVYTWRSR